MTWLPERKTWKKIYRGERYYVSVRQLAQHFNQAIQATEVGSYQFANRWWLEKQLELDNVQRPPALPFEDLAAAFRGLREGLLDERSVIHFVLQDLDRQAQERQEYESRFDVDPETLPEATPERMRRRAIILFLQETLIPFLVDGTPLPDAVQKFLPAARVEQLHAGGAALRGAQAVSPEQSLEHWQTQYLASKCGARDRLRLVRHYLNAFVQHAGPQVDVRSVNEKVLQGYYQVCKEKAEKPKTEGGMTGRSARDAFGVVRTFLRWLVEMNAIDQPRNLESRRRDAVPQQGAHVHEPQKGKLPAVAPDAPPPSSPPEPPGSCSRERRRYAAME
jgi:hypothetical protein